MHPGPKRLKGEHFASREDFHKRIKDVISSTCPINPTETNCSEFPIPLDVKLLSAAQILEEFLKQTLLHGLHTFKSAAHTIQNLMARSHSNI